MLENNEQVPLMVVFELVRKPMEILLPNHKLVSLVHLLLEVLPKVLVVLRTILTRQTRGFLWDLPVKKLSCRSKQREPEISVKKRKVILCCHCNEWNRKLKNKK